MGLDIHAASHLRYDRPIPRGKALDRLDEEMSAKGRGLDDLYFFLSGNAACHRQRLGGMRPGLYAYTKQTRQYGFRAGSYSGYNWWRDQLSRFALGVPAEEVWLYPREYTGRPFVPLINFTDCDGRIGTPVAAKLAADFTSHAARAKRYAPTAEDGDDEAGVTGWLEVYRDFARAFRLAAKDGALRFC